MASPATFPNPYLVAILLVCITRSGSGAQLVFHYPDRPYANDSIAVDESSALSQSDEDSTTNSDESTVDDDGFTLNGATTKPSTQTNTTKSKTNGEDDDGISSSTWAQPTSSRNKTGDSLFGLAEDGLVSLLTPDRTWHKRKFELGVNDLTFVGRPVFVRADGYWRKPKSRRQPASKPDPDASDTATGEDSDTKHKFDVNDDTSSAPQNAAGGKSPLTMFHVVFVINPPPLEHTNRVKDIYEHVIKKLSKVLKWEQARVDYIWRETETILSIKSSELAKKSASTTVCAEILAKSSLAVAISEVYTAISNSRIASVKLSPKVSFALQIPPVTFTSYLPSLTDPPIQPGLWLTTATDIGSTGNEVEGVDANHALHLSKHYTLLLKSPPHRIAKDVMEAGGPLAAHMPKFVSSLRPTKSLYKLSLSTQMSLADIQVLARHLSYWRRAIAIPPLHSKDVYIVSPNADMKKLREATKSYDQQIVAVMPIMPSLPRILSALSTTPKSFGSLIPSTDHKESYYLALAWLLRNGWVTQLRTFAYVRIDPEIKRFIQENDRVTAPQVVPRQRSLKEDSRASKEMEHPRKRPSIVSRPSSEGKRSADGNWPKHNPRMASLVLNPPRASPEESKWLEFIESSLTSDNTLFSLTSEDRVELQKYWPAFLRYFNGQVALETIAIREGLKRKFFWKLLNKVGLDLERQGGVEDSTGENRAILVPIRHW